MKLSLLILALAVSMATCFDISQIEEMDMNTLVEDTGVLADYEEAVEQQ